MGALGKLNLLLSACMRCRTLVDTNVLLYVLCSSVQGRRQALLLCFRYVDTAAIGAWAVPSWCAQKKQVQKLNKKGGETIRTLAQTDANGNAMLQSFLSKLCQKEIG